MKTDILFLPCQKGIVLGNGAVMVLTEENRLTVAVVW